MMILRFLPGPCGPRTPLLFVFLLFPGGGGWTNTSLDAALVARARTWRKGSTLTRPKGAICPACRVPVGLPGTRTEHHGA